MNNLDHLREEADVMRLIRRDYLPLLNREVAALEDSEYPDRWRLVFVQAVVAVMDAYHWRCKPGDLVVLEEVPQTAVRLEVGGYVTCGWFHSIRRADGTLESLELGFGGWHAWEWKARWAARRWAKRAMPTYARLAQIPDGSADR